MTNWKTGAKVGIVVIMVLGLTYYAFKRVHEGVGGGSGYVLRARFADATGLVDKSKVVIAGIQVGQIVGKDLAGKKAEIKFFVKKKYKIYSNACIFKKSESLMGGFYLEIDPGSPSSRDPRNPEGPLKENKLLKSKDEIICVHEAPTMDQIMRSLTNMAPKVQDLVVEVNKLVKGSVTDTVNVAKNAIALNGAALKTLLDRANTIAVDVKAMTGPMPSDVNRIVRNIRVITDRTRRLVYDVKSLLTTGKGEVQSTGTKVRDTLARLDKAIDKLDGVLSQGKTAATNIKSITKDVKKVTGMVAQGRGNLGKFLTDESIAKNVKVVAKDLKDLSRSVMGLKTIIGLKSEYNIMAATLKTYVMVRLQPKNNKYYLIELIDDPRGKVNREETITQYDPPNGPQTHTKTTTVASKFRFSFMFAKRVDFATFRFGIKESTGGVGLDLHLWKDRIQFTSDIFDFSANDYPRLKLSLSFEFYKRFSIVAGVDDVINSSGSGLGTGVGRDFFVGAQLTFNDEDLKALLLFGGSMLGAAASQ